MGVRNIACPHRIHCNVDEIFLEVDVVSDHVIEKSCLPKTFLEELFRPDFRPIFQ
jgi:hypothetical protein